MPTSDKPDDGKKYARVIFPRADCYEEGKVPEPIWVDVYSVLAAFPDYNPGVQHAAKKILAAGRLGTKDRVKDLEEAVTALKRAIEIEKTKIWKAEYGEKVELPVTHKDFVLTREMIEAENKRLAGESYATSKFPDKLLPDSPEEKKMSHPEPHPLQEEIVVVKFKGTHFPSRWKNCETIVSVKVGDWVDRLFPNLIQLGGSSESTDYAMRVGANDLPKDDEIVRVRLLETNEWVWVHNSEIQVRAE